MKKILLSILFILLLSTITIAQGNCVYFFYGNGCNHCESTYPLMDQLEQTHEIHRFETWENLTNRNLLLSAYKQYNIDLTKTAVPTAIIEKEIFIGSNQILEHLETAIERTPETNCPKIEITTIGKSGIEQISLLTIISAALADSINPCAIAVLLILLTSLMSTGNKKRALKSGLAFTLSIYIAYFLFGLGLLSVIQFAGLSNMIYNIIGIIAIIIGLANIKDFIWYGGGGFVMEIPRSWRPILKNFLNSITSPLGAFLAGFVVCLFELPCTGGPYLFILGLLAEKTTQLAAIPILLLYNIFFILPLLIITILLYYGKSDIKTISTWKEKNIRSIHLITGLIMLGLGTIVLMGWV